MPHATRRPRTPLPVRHALAAAALAALQLNAAAQTAPPPTQLQTITVTAERRVENIQDVPSSISVVSGDLMDALSAGGQDVRNLAGRVPSLNIESSFGRAFPRFYLRGYGNTDFHLNASQPVSLVYDDVVQENPILKGFPVFDVQGVEVLAGPQGTLFGRNTPAGVVKFDSVAPSHKRDAYVAVGLGNYGTINAEGAGNIALGPDWAMRVSVQDQHRKDWVHNTYAQGQTPATEGYEDFALRLQALYQPSPDFSALFNIHHRDLNGSPRLFRAGIIQPGTNNLIAGFSPDRMSIDGVNAQHVTSTGANARLKWSLPGFDLHSITAIETVKPFSRGDVDGGSAPYTFFASPTGALNVAAFPVETSDALHGHRQLTQEFRLESRQAGPLSWQAGLYAFDERYTWENIDYGSAPPYGTGVPLYAETHQANQAWALFGEAKYQVTDRFKVGAGLRYTRDKKQLYSYVPAVGGQTLDAANGFAADTSDTKTTWDLSALYAITRDTNVYARIGTGFRASTTLPAGEFGPLSQAGPETITSYEAGIKSDFWDRRGRLSAAVYRYDVSHLQLTEVGGGGNSNTVKSANKVVGQGFELSLELLPLDNLTVSLNTSLNDAKIHDPGLTVAGCGGGCTVTNPAVPGGGGEVYVNGNQLPNAPRWTGNLNARYAFPTGGGSEYYVYTDWTYRSSVSFFLYQSIEFTGKALTEGGLRAGYNWNSGKYDLAVYVRNLTNQIRVTGAIDFNNLTGFINDPRTYGVQFKAVF
ncbi:MAG: TonB-dependent receptor [Burkholderiales bacterium]|nr:TonB-dependent receptor [Burkholderiales bacterium]